MKHALPPAISSGMKPQPDGDYRFLFLYIPCLAGL